MPKRPKQAVRLTIDQETWEIFHLLCQEQTLWHGGPTASGVIEIFMKAWIAQPPKDQKSMLRVLYKFILQDRKAPAKPQAAPEAKPEASPEEDT